MTYDGAHAIAQGDVLAVLRELPSNEFDACLCDPPYGFSFMGKKWDYDVPSVDVWRELLRVLKPGAPLISFGGTRTFHRVAVGIEDAGFELRDVLSWMYGCLSEDTEILVDGQWEPYHRATTGRLAMCYDMGTDEYSWQPISQLFVYAYDDTAYRIQSDSTDQVVSRNHRCIVERSGAYAFELAEDVARECEARVPVLESLSNLLLALPMPDKGAPQAVRASRFTRSDLARIEAFHLRGLVWCVSVPTGAFVARRNGKVFVTGNSGFPKSLDVSKALDKAAGAKREVVGVRPNPDGYTRTASRSPTVATGAPNSVAAATVVSAPSTPLAQQWAGYGTALKPAWESAVMARKPLDIATSMAGVEGLFPNWEPAILARKPLEGNVAANVARHGVGGLAIDACRIEGVKPLRENTDGDEGLFGMGSRRAAGESSVGRWPANVILDEEAGAALDAQAGNRPGNANKRLHARDEDTGHVWGYFGERTGGGMGRGDSGGASRFFYSAKVSTKEREFGCDTVERIEMRFTMPGSEVRTVQLLVDTASSPPRAISASGMCSSSESEWSTFLFGSQSAAPFRPACRFTTRTGTSSTTVSKTWKHSPLLSTSGSTQALSSETEIGGSPVPSAASSSPLTESIGTSPKDTQHTPGASHATLLELFERSESVEIAISEALPKRGAAEMTSSEEGQARLDSPRMGAGRGGSARCHHPTLKPIALTRWLARLIMPPTPNAQLLVPYSGAGSEMIGSLQAGWPMVFGIEGEQEYVDIANARIAAWKKGSP